MTKLTYNLCLLYRSKPFGIISLQTDNTLILLENFFATIKENTIKMANIMTTEYAYLTSEIPIKFNSTLI